MQYFSSALYIDNREVTMQLKVQINRPRNAHGLKFNVEKIYHALSQYRDRN